MRRRKDKFPKMLHVAYPNKGQPLVAVTARGLNKRLAHKVMVPDGNDKFREEALNRTDGQWWPLNPACLDDYPSAGWTLTITEKTPLCRVCFGKDLTIGEEQKAKQYRDSLTSMIIGFEYENCAECGKDMNEHVIVPFMGQPFAQCMVEQEAEVER